MEALPRIELDKYDAREPAECARAGRQRAQRRVDSSLLRSDEQTPRNPGYARTHG